MIRQIILIVSLIGISNAAYQCKDNNGSNVDWFVFYKLPHLWNHPDNVPISNGTGFLYFDVNNKNWKLMPQGMDVENNAVYYTLQQYYNSNMNTTFSYMYNDEWPDSTIWSNSSGHAKGVTVFDQYTGFWMIHSIPKFPSKDMFRFPSNAHYYGQMGICISYNTVSLATIAQQLFYYNTFTYQFNLPQSFANQFPVLSQLKNKEYNKSPPLTSTKVLKSLGGQHFRHFAKTGEWGKDLYSDFVGPTLKSSIKVETWNHQSGDEYNLPSVCDPNHVQSTMSAKYIRLPYAIDYSSYEDHSKFVVAYSESSSKPPIPYVCIGDINRQSHQIHRGGGTMCIYDQETYFQFANIISETVPCTKATAEKVDALANNRYF
ncbi:Cell death-related nuclease 6 [Caenorhabditis elegans]|uniref:Isoform a of Cell death-related nuclease 6 n=1 Tax=Caenorhabditis elegans TaxID=6239 RepID=P34508-2|nr:Cell death-related nuclease 6 [Caenorhabditis elegans]AAP57302.1 cell death-related nuclease 6 [Caenorhabditis elegans]CAB76843.1 Cell death-related nuclease 6 [Caenorhabditis elegans]|eukprot:NP_499062.1 Cell death-related nuclease 6 [Caenorhabditis elegans]